MVSQRGRSSLFLAAMLAYCFSAGAQQLARRPQSPATRGQVYAASRETVLEGTVVSYTLETSRPPIGAHLVLQTGRGAVDLHLGAASFLQANHFSLAKGDSVRVIGMNSSTRQGSVFLVRVIQKGGQSLTLRTTKGALLSRSGGRAMRLQKSQQQAVQPEGPR